MIELNDKIRKYIKSCIESAWVEHGRGCKHFASEVINDNEPLSDAIYKKYLIKKDLRLWAVDNNRWIEDALDSDSWDYYGGATHDDLLAKAYTLMNEHIIAKEIRRAVKKIKYEERFKREAKSAEQ